MMMLRVENTGTSAQTIGSHVDVPAGQSRYFPADRCSFRTTYNATAGQYEISDAYFYPGTSTAVDLSTTNTTSHLGFIGKSGRFVEMTD